MTSIFLATGRLEKRIFVVFIVWGNFTKILFSSHQLWLPKATKLRKPPACLSAAALPKNGLQGRVWGGIAGHFLSYIVCA
ncbi:MAG: hypothetical protein ACHP6I_03715, partial [Rickettsiales bacterium]